MSIRLHLAACVGWMGGLGAIPGVLVGAALFGKVCGDVAWGCGAVGLGKSLAAGARYVPDEEDDDQVMLVSMRARLPICSGILSMGARLPIVGNVISTQAAPMSTPGYQSKSGTDTTFKNIMKSAVGDTLNMLWLRLLTRVDQKMELSD
jgi:hypothetical protein